MSKLTSIDWWMGRTPDQRQRKLQVKKDWADAKIEFHSETKKSDFASRLSRWGWTLLFVVTIPILGLVFGGFVGLGIGVVIAVVYLVSRTTGEST
ncbi:hypothetical protein LCGC14_1122070 [marine sediment metagenome]|uniref:Uncharacterized protein n=1 Tax=marine sediment metagenome TaxID=412755 RepID=A0A0F9MRG7_9ZZZZ